MTNTTPKIDWSQAPTETAVWCAALNSSGKRYEGWHEKLPNGDYLPVGPGHVSSVVWLKSNENDLFKVYTRLALKWYETGDLPPVGECVIIDYDVIDEDSRYVGHKGLEAVIIAHDEYDGHDIAIYRITNDERRRHEYHALVAKCFKPVPTEEEKAEMVREAFKAQFSQDWNSLNGDFYGRVKQLYDLGYRKQEDAQ